MKFQRKRALLMLIDAAIVVTVSVLLQLLVLYGPDSLVTDSPAFSGLAWLAVAIITVAVIGCRVITGVYRCVWRYVGITNYLRIVIADVAADAVLTVFFIIARFGLGFTSTALVVLVSCLLSLISRFAYQAAYARLKIAEDMQETDKDHRINIAIIGAGNIGAALADELMRNPQAHYRPLFFVDIDPAKAGLRLFGLPIYPEDAEINNRIRNAGVQEIVIALPDMTGEARERLYNQYKSTGCKVKLYDYPVGSTSESKRQLREFNIEDVLFRDPIDFDNKQSLEFYRDKTVLVTGGGGSIGSELCRQIAAMKPKRLVIFDIYENNAYDIQQELIRRYGAELSLDVLIGSVRDVDRLEEVFATYRPDVVLHAAAHKHVPLMEKSPAEVVKNNVLGTYNTANMAEKYGVSRFVLISTDKAVNPTNVMGASKRLCEMIVQCRQDSATRFVAVRFGNVLGSNGSVIPLFKRQIAEGGPITITDKRIIRYFMTIPEAASLVLEAGSIAKRGELFVLDMGKPIHIYDLARNMIRMSGLVPDVDIEIKEIGLRPGEKLYEELLIQSEQLERTENSLIFIEKDTPLSREQVEAKLMILGKALKTPTPENITAAMHRTVETFHTPEEVNRVAASAREMQEANA